MLLSWEPMEHVSHIDKMAAFEMWSFKDLPQMCLNQLIKNTDKAAQCLSSRVHVSAPYNSTEMTIDWKNLKSGVT